MQTDSRSRGQSESYSQNTQRLGRELMTMDELTTMPGDKCILQLRGLRLFFSPKYDLKQHPNYRSTAWAANKGSGCSISMTLDQTHAQTGWGMRFDYSESAGGYAGATINKETDWSSCDALQFWTIPDGKQQKTVVQIQGNDTCYEVYLNLYDAYNAHAGKPTLVTIPFAEFCQRDTPGNPKGGLTADCAKVSSISLWVNAVENSSFQNGSVCGTIWYDNITAVKSGAPNVTFLNPAQN